MAFINIELDLLLIGKTGSGKSALGNLILRRNAFASYSSFTSITTKVQYEVSEFKDRVIKVVDAPGVGDTRLEKETSTEWVLEAMSNAISVNPRGYHAFLLVVKFGGRFTEEEQNVIVVLKKTFGQNFVKKYCILSITHGDNFESEFAETSTTFEKWCEMQEGIFRDLYEECNKRALLFNNKAKDVEKKSKQVEKLINMVDLMTYQNHRYTDCHFQEARKEREKMLVESKIPIISEETMTEASLIIQKLKGLQDVTENKQNLTPLNELLNRAKALYDRIEKQDLGTEALNNLLQTVMDMQNAITIQISVQEKVCKILDGKLKWYDENYQAKVREIEEKYKKIKEENDEGTFKRIINSIQKLFSKKGSSQ